MCSFGKEGIYLMQLCLFILQRADLKSHVHTRLIIGMVLCIMAWWMWFAPPIFWRKGRFVRTPPPPPPLRTPLYVALCIRMSCVLLFNAANRTVLTQLRAWVSRTLHITMPHVLVTKLMTRLLIVAFYIVTILVLAFYTTDPDTFSNS